MKLPKLYVIADRETLQRHGMGAGEFAHEMHEAGIRLLQWRDKLSGPQGVLAGAQEIAAAFAGCSDALLIMNDRPDLAALAGWIAVHVGQGDLSPEDARRVLNQQPSVIGLSTHNDAQVIAAAQSIADYIAIGPVFATGTKSDAEPVVGLEGVRRARALTQKSLVAIGGITPANARSVLDAGADSIAVISALFAEGKRPGQVAGEFLRALA